MAKKKYSDKDAHDTHHEANKAHDMEGGFDSEGDEADSETEQCGGEGMDENCEYS